MTTESLYRLHTDALDEITLLRIADRIHETNPNQQVLSRSIAKAEREIMELIEYETII